MSKTYEKPAMISRPILGRDGPIGGKELWLVHVVQDIAREDDAFRRAVEIAIETNLMKLEQTVDLLVAEQAKRLGITPEEVRELRGLDEPDYEAMN